MTLSATIRRIAAVTVVALAAVAGIMLQPYRVAQLQGTYTLVISSPEPLPNCTPGTSVKSAPLIWDATIAQLSVCTGINIWTPITSSGSLGVVVLSSGTAGTHWTDKLVTANTALGVNGGTIFVPDSIADNGAGTTPNIGDNVAIITPGSGTFTMCTLNMGKYSKWYNWGSAALIESGSSCGGMTFLGPTATLQDYDKNILQNVRINCAGQPTSTGMNMSPSANAALFDVSDLSITGCTTVGLIANVQFSHFSHIHLNQNFVNMKMYASGGDSNHFDNSFFASPGSGVDVIIWTNSSSQATNDLLFTNCTMQNATVAAVALIGNATLGAGSLSVKFDRGAPELNGGGAASVTIDGNVIPQSGFLYASNAAVQLQSVDFSDAVANPDINLTNGSVLTLTDPYGYGRTGGKLVTSDSTSSVIFKGTNYAQGNISSVIGWPQYVSGQYQFYQGEPVSNYTSGVTNVAQSDPQTPAFQITTGIVGTGTAVDPKYGVVETAQFAASTGSKNTNRVIYSGVTTAIASTDLIVSVLLKASVATDFICGGVFGDNFSFSDGGRSLPANQWTRLVVFNGKIATATDVGLICFPGDNAGATISFTRLQMSTFPTSQGSTIAMSQVLEGAVNPNKFSQSCGTTSTCSATKLLNPQTVSGTVALSGGTVTITGISPAFSSSTSFSVVANDTTTIANPVKCVPASASSITCTGTGTDVISYIATGN